MKLLLVDDDPELVDMLTVLLRREGFTVLTALDGPTARKHLATGQPDLAVLDINLGAWNGFDLLKDLRRRSQIPVIMLTGRTSEEDKVLGLELGADDYLTKPFRHRELVARIRANLRRSAQEWAAPKPEQTTLHVGPVALSVVERAVAKEGEPIDLTATEFRLLHYLMINAGTVVPTNVLLKQVWGTETQGSSDVVRVAVHRLRRKIEDDPANPQLLHTVSGIGFMMKPPSM